MNFKKHYVRNQHAFLSPSSYHWINYTPEKLMAVYANTLAAEEGTKLHDFAARCINLGRYLAGESEDDTLALYVNDCISEEMQAEELLWYSDNCFGTADAIKFRDGVLKIFDLKTGKSGNIIQLMIYAALFCLEYDYDPREIIIELRLYKQGQIEIKEPKPEEILEIMGTIMEFDGIIEEMNRG